ncbi:MAG TPA: carboxypeptidase regulatory-like domain-containing protein [Candidatus Rifleibacterium sp.]|nr:carboxypeptidase regulatory-like domain-containing protein [Candidatus Rifleibacterium sp.]HPT46956.1 carboxypeptidase regulatory-like domain-containing protein [Candidatus Rifleibacterium sp.]
MKNFRKTFALLLAMVVLVGITGCLKSSSSVKGNVTGKVFDSNGKALHEARVEVYGANNSVLTDELGRYTITNVDPGQRKLVATFDKKSVVKIVEIVRGETLENADLTFSVIDGLPPVITGVSIDNSGENSALIKWETNESSDSTVDYATGPVGLTPFTMVASDPSMVTSHTVTLTSLLPGQTYHFRVRSMDFERNEGVSSEYQFSTPSGAAPATPAGFVIAGPTEMERIVLSWASNSETDLAGYNLYRSESATGNFTRVNANPISSGVGSTTYQDEGLKIACKYYYRLKAIDVAGNESQPTATLSVVTPGTLSENRTWLAAESPYIMQGDVRVRGGSVLTIESGCEIRFTQKDSLPDPQGSNMADLIIQGGLMAVGTSNQRILFTSAESFPRKSVWGGIFFLGTTQPDNILRHATVMFADTGIKSEGSTPSIEYCEFGLCGIGLNLGLSTALNIRYNTIRDCDIGMVSANSNIRNNLFIDNQTGVTLLGSDQFENNTVDCLIGVQVDAGTPTIKNNIIAYTGSTKAIYGINQTLTLATPTISFNDIHNYTYAFNGTNSTGTANIEVDPLFVGGTPYSYQLQKIADGNASDSPCLTAGEAGAQQGRYGP